ncbi:MAG: energy transducer TonB [Gemmatimonadales bacterium]|nr:energy transducer TonB [Gemmatimonadales bacterium]
MNNGGIASAVRLGAARRLLPALAAALVLNVVLLASAALLSRERTLVQDLTDPVAVRLVSLKPPTSLPEKKKVEPPKPKAKPKPDFQPEILRPAIGVPAPTGFAVALDRSLFAGGPARGDFIFNAADLDQPPVAVVNTSPIYPFKARQRDIEGFVTLKFLVGVDGSVSRTEVLDSRPKGLFETALLKVVPAWKFRPGMIDGHPVPTWVEKTVRFQLNN